MSHNQALVLAAFRTNAAGADHVGARDRIGAAGRQSRKSRDLRELRRPCAKRISGMRQRRKSAPAAALELAKGRDVQYASAFALAVSGDSSRSQSRRRSGKTIPGGYPVQFGIFPRCARFPRFHESPPDAIEHLKRRSPMIWRCQARRSSQSLEGYIRFMCAARHIGSRAGAGGRDGIPESASSSGYCSCRSMALWRTYNWEGRSIIRRKRSGQGVPTRSSSLFGR